MAGDFEQVVDGRRQGGGAGLGTRFGELYELVLGLRAPPLDQGQLPLAHRLDEVDEFLTGNAGGGQAVFLRFDLKSKPTAAKPAAHPHE